MTDIYKDKKFFYIGETGETSEPGILRTSKFGTDNGAAGISVNITLTDKLLSVHIDNQE